MNLPRIKLLSPLLANQIAAGEVIERPASVVKELLENSLDAGATRIEIEIEKGGKQLIRVRDNGGGIHADDLILAASRHATSKIATLDDLAQVQSLGFRGEALASIAAVSRFRIVSAVSNTTAYQLVMEGDDVQAQVSPAAHPYGTTVEVRELFFNAPVRRRFLRTEKTEFSHILDIIHKICLSRDNLALTLIHNQQRVLQISTADDIEDRSRRIAKICSKNFIENSLYFVEEAEGLMLQGWISRMDVSYSHANLQYFFLNGRIVRDKLLNHALRVAAQNFLPAGRHLAYVLYFGCEPQLVDVNVHPTKHEVRFQESRLIHDFIVSALHRVWQQKISDYVRPIIAESESIIEPFSIAEESAEYHVDSKRFGKLLGQIHQRYLLVEAAQGLIIIDIIAARELIFTRMLHNATIKKPLLSKALLWPVSVNLSSAQLKNLQAKLIDWQSLGIIWQTVSEHQIVIRRVPDMLAETDLKTLFINLSTAAEPINFIAKFAAQSQTIELSTQQMQQLLNQLDASSELEIRNVMQVITLQTSKQGEQNVESDNLLSDAECLFSERTGCER